jgi:hypothetical protein
LVSTACIALVLVLGLLASCPEAHHWLHHDADSPGHECAVVVFAHGLTTAGDCAVPLAIFLILIAAATGAYRNPEFALPRYAHRPERGPP